MENIIGERIKRRRKELHLTQVQIKELCGVYNGNLSDIEKGNKLPSAGTLVALSKALQVSIDWILTGEEYHNRNITFEKLPPADAELLELFRQLDPDDRGELMDFARLKIARRARGGAGSSSSGDPDLLKDATGGGVVSA